MSLHEEPCEACLRDAVGVSEAEKEEFFAQLSGWELVQIDGIERLAKSFKFKNFKEALAFTNAVSALAEEVNHHPALLTEWGSVEVFWWTHTIGGLHRNDFILAAKTDQLRT